MDMPAEDDAARHEILARLAQSREELRQLLDPVRTELDGEMGPGDHGQGFPRSRTMQMLMSGRGFGTLAAVAGGLFIARPALALRLIRMLPASALARWAMVRAVTALRGRGGTTNGAGTPDPAPGVNPTSPARSDSGRHPRA
jgi:hypothetical protein